MYAFFARGDEAEAPWIVKRHVTPSRLFAVTRPRETLGSRLHAYAAFYLHMSHQQVLGRCTTAVELGPNDCGSILHCITVC